MRTYTEHKFNVPDLRKSNQTYLVIQEDGTREVKYWEGDRLRTLKIDDVFEVESGKRFDEKYSPFKAEKVSIEKTGWFNFIGRVDNLHGKLIQLTGIAEID